MSLHENTDVNTSDNRLTSFMLNQSSQRIRTRKTNALLHHIEAELISTSKLLIQQMYGSAEDLFYDLSKRASSNNEQNLYFESMREIRIKKGALTLAFIEGLKASFVALHSGQTKDSTRHHDTDLEFHNLAMVEREALEIDIAAKTMADRTCELFKQEIHDFTRRLEHLVPDNQLSNQSTPLAPQIISLAFVNACFDTLNINTKARLIFFKVFEKQFLKQLDKVYCAVNNHLIDAGILPKLPKTIKRQQQAANPRTSGQVQDKQQELKQMRDREQDVAAPQADSLCGTVSISSETLATLMSAIRQANALGGSHYHIYCTNPGPLFSTQDLTNALSKKQPVVDKKIARNKPQNFIPLLVNELLKKGCEQSPRALAQAEEYTINLITLFFDKILQNHQLPLIAQSLICRLQIPLLKLALNDTAFLSQPDHAARKLINIITQASAKLDSSKSLERDPLYRLIVDGIQTINHQYDVNTESFASLCNTIVSQLEKEHNKSAIIEKRTEQTEIGKARIKRAKALAQSTIFDKLKDQKLPATAMNFLVDAWQQVLVLTQLKEGHESHLWNENDALISDLIWLCKPKDDERSQTRAFRLIPDILTKVDQGLNAAMDDPLRKQEQISELETMLFAVANNESLNTLQCLTSEQLALLGKSNEPAIPAWNTIDDEKPTEHSELSQEYFVKAKELTEGSWLEYTDEDDKLLLCKLSKKIDADSYIFVNRFGVKNLEKSRRSLAMDLQQDRAKILDITPLFDRVMDDIFSEFNIKAA
ncbi:hypothetical protein TDB9533_00152 [Thalassocella blandensis]|nr:hypothetical protein TDB9533_00152 [Thalassocella blandensis]